MPRSLFPLFGLLLLAIPLLPAQQAAPPTPEISQSSNPTSEQLQSWLHSADPRLIAWAAYFADARGDSVALDTMQTLVAQQKLLPPTIQDATGYGTSRALAAILDALIRQRVQLATYGITSIAGKFPVQAVLLASALPTAQARGLYTVWYQLHNDGTPNDQLLARLSTLLLADEPPPAVVASIVDEASEHLTLNLIASNQPTYGLGAGSSCDDGMGFSNTPGWPPVFTYDVEENNPQSTSPLLVAVDEDRIHYIRYPDNGVFGSCYGVQPLNAITRHRLIAHWLGVPDAEVPWHPAASVSILWTTRDAYLLTLGRAVEAQHAAMMDTVRTLVRKGILAAADASDTQPRLILTVVCDIQPCPLGGDLTRPPMVFLDDPE